MFMDLVEKVNRAYGDFSPQALDEEWRRRVDAQDFSINGLSYGKAMLQKAFDVLRTQEPKNTGILKTED